MHWILSSFQQAGFNECFKRLGNLLDIVSHKRGKLFARQEGARMPMQKHKQIEVAGVAKHTRPREDTGNFFRVRVGWI